LPKLPAVAAGAKPAAPAVGAAAAKPAAAGAKVPPLAAAGAPAATTCPGIVAGVCTLPCQVAVCGALAAFYNDTFNTSAPWFNSAGWELITSLGCGRLVTPEAAARPVYCGWTGIACCTPAAVAQGLCSVVNAVANLSLPVNQLNGSVSTPAILDAFEALHACGMVVLDLEANDISGVLSPRLGSLTNLAVLSMGRRACAPRPALGAGTLACGTARGGGSDVENSERIKPRLTLCSPPLVLPHRAPANTWIGGRIPDELAALKKLRRLELGANFHWGTVGAWVADLIDLEVLSLGANSGDNPPDPETGEVMAGLVGTIPSGLSNLQKLVELDLQV
jgi:hypothetical protein